MPTYTGENDKIYRRTIVFPRTVWKKGTILQSIADKAPLFAPGTRFSYSNTNYYLLGLIAEKVTGFSYEDALDRFVIKPLDLRHTFAPKPGSPRLTTQSANGYMETSPDNPRLREYSEIDPSYPWAAGSMISTTVDLAKFAVAVYKRSLLQGTFADELYFEVKEAPGYFYGAGIIKNESDRTVGHYGEIFGFECSTKYLAKRDIAISACLNRSLFDKTLPPGTTIDSILTDKIVKLFNDDKCGGKTKLEVSQDRDLF